MKILRWIVTVEGMKKVKVNIIKMNNSEQCYE